MRRSERGANLVELAIVTPLLLLLIAGIADLGRAFHAYMIITNGSREGARYAARYPDHLLGIQQAAIDEAANSQVTLTAADVTRTFPAGGSEGGDPVRVTVTLDVPTIVGGILGFTNLSLTAQTEMVIFGFDAP